MASRSTPTMAKDILNPTTEEAKHINKHKNIFAFNRGAFIKLTCKCEAEKICYSHTQTQINCEVCDSILLVPSGGFAKLGHEVTYTFLKREF